MSVTWKKRISKFLTTRPLNFLVTWPNEYRRGLALCAAVRIYREYATSSNEIIMPSLLSGLTLCGGSLIFPLIEQNILPHSVTVVNKKFILDSLTWRLKTPFLCAFYYNICLMYKSKAEMMFPFELPVVIAFIAVPTVEWLCTLISSKTKV
jgi:hypothetical protein